MQIYTPGSEIGVLQPWPFDNPESNYKILSGAPAASGRIDTGGWAIQRARASGAAAPVPLNAQSRAMN